MRQTHTYATLEVSRATFEDVRARLDRAGVLTDYMQTDGEGSDVIVFGSVGLMPEEEPPPTFYATERLSGEGEYRIVPHVVPLKRLTSITILLLLFAGVASAKLLRGTVTKVHDADTPTISNKRVTEPVRLLAVDAPESAQAFGAEAQKIAAQRAYKKQARVLWRKRDGRGRIAGRVLIGGKDLGYELLRAGAVWYYPEYSRELSPAMRARYKRAMDDARAAGVGLWADPNPMPPWEFRRLAAQKKVALRGHYAQKFLQSNFRPANIRGRNYVRSRVLHLRAA